MNIRSAPHIQTTISLQNSLVRRGWHPRMHNGKTPAYGVLMVAALPYESAAWACDEGGIVNFQAQRPVSEPYRTKPSHSVGRSADTGLA